MRSPRLRQNDLFDGPSDARDSDTPVLSELVREISSTPASVIHTLGKDLIIEYPHAFDPSLSLKVFDAIDKTTPWRQDQIRIAGRTIPVPRLQCWMGDEHCRYAYSILVSNPVPWTQEMASIRDFVNKVSGCSV